MNGSISGIASQYQISGIASQYQVLVSGSSGLVGSALLPFLSAEGFGVTPLLRSSTKVPSMTGLRWDPLNVESFPVQVNCDAVVHLAGEPIFAIGFTAAKKRRIRESRVQGTENLCRALSKLQTKPKVLICASAIGYYGDRGDEELSEQSPPGTGFLPEVCVEWERATVFAEDAGIRVINLRIGLVLSPQGGALQKMLLPFRLGLGGTIGNGRQYMSWIAKEDLVQIIHFCLTNSSIAGPVNATSPKAVTNREFTYALASALHRPAVLPVPASMLRLLFREFAEQGLLASAMVAPKKLLEAGYQFEFSSLHRYFEATFEESGK